MEPATAHAVDVITGLSTPVGHQATLGQRQADATDGDTRAGCEHQNVVDVRSQVRGSPTNDVADVEIGRPAVGCAARTSDADAVDVVTAATPCPGGSGGQCGHDDRDAQAGDQAAVVELLDQGHGWVSLSLGHCAPGAFKTSTLCSSLALHSAPMFEPVCGL